MRWRADCILERKASEVMTSLDACLSQKSERYCAMGCQRDGPRVLPKVCFLGGIANHSLVMGVEVRVIVDFKSRGLKGSRDL